MNLALALIAAVSGIGMVVCLALGLCRAASNGDHLYRDACEQRRRQERQARSVLRPDTGWVTAAPRQPYVVSDLTKSPRRRNHAPGPDKGA